MQLRRLFRALYLTFVVTDRFRETARARRGEEEGLHRTQVTEIHSAISVEIGVGRVRKEN